MTCCHHLSMKEVRLISRSNYALNKLLGFLKCSQGELISLGTLRCLSVHQYSPMSMETLLPSFSGQHLILFRMALQVLYMYMIFIFIVLFCLF